MKSKIMLILLGLFFISAAPLCADPEIKDYQSSPFWLEEATVPQVLLVLERDWKIFYPAYNNLSDLDGDGVIDIGYNPGVTYAGYFDSDSCYYYTENDAKPYYTFVRVGPTQAQSETELQALIPPEIKKISQGIYTEKEKDKEKKTGMRHPGLHVPISKHGVCNRNKATRSGQGEWHGNWLNFSTTSRMDALRKVLYGGRRVVDSPNETIIELIHFLPSNAHTWGGELPADNLWEEYYKTSPWYDIPSFTGYTRPDKDTMHFWARSSYYTPNLAGQKYDYTTPYPDSDKYLGVVPEDVANGNPYYEYMRRVHKSTNRILYSRPLFLVSANVPVKNNFHPTYLTPLRYWDWIGDHGGGFLPNDFNIAAGIDTTLARKFVDEDHGKYKAKGRASRAFHARVKVCDKNNLGKNEKCRDYNGSYKPIGLLQEYGESQKMYFGLLSGTLDGATRFRGGVIRHHIQEFSEYVDLSNGSIKRPGMIDTIDRFQITGIAGYLQNNPRAIRHNAYSDGTQAGNPLGEMIYEGVRYIARDIDGKNFLSPNQYYVPSSEVKLPSVNDIGNGSDSDIAKRTELPRLGGLNDWKNRSVDNPKGRPSLKEAGNNCAKPVILVLSEGYPDHDSYSQNEYPRMSDFDKVPLLKSFVGSKVPQKLDINAYLDIITDQEKLKTSSENKQFFFPTLDRGVCRPADLANGLRDINGHCPSEPSLEGSYSMAAVAYYAHTHDLFNKDGANLANSDIPEKPVDFYAVELPPNFPDITFAVDEARSLTLMPITVARDKNSSEKLRTLINFFIETWETDAYGKPIRTKFATNFEYNTYPSWNSGSGSNNMERDIFNRFDIILLTDASTPQKFREPVPVFINSGMLRTTTPLDEWHADKDAYYKNNVPFPTSNKAGRPYYYAFKTPNPNDAGYEPLDITKHKIIGVAIQNYSHGSFINQPGYGGYSISGVKYSGTYLDVGYYGIDNFYYRDPRCTDTRNVPLAQKRPVPTVLTADMRPDAYTPCDDLKKPRFYPNANPNKETARGSFPDRRGLPPGYGTPQNINDPLSTPWECPYAGYLNKNRDDPDVVKAYGPKPANWNPAAPDLTCGTINQDRSRWKTRYYQMRSFEFDKGAKKIAKLPSPMFLAAKYGGFKDSNKPGEEGFGVPDAYPDPNNEWRRGGDGIDKDDPYNYFGVTNLSQLPDQLGKAFEAIYNSVATGTANASSINSILGGGISIQTQYYSEYVDKVNPQLKLKWTGSVYALFVDKWGNLRADTNYNPKTGKNGDQRLNLITSPKESDWADIYPGKSYSSKEMGDLIVHTVPHKDKIMPSIYLCRDVYGDNNGGVKLPSDKHPPCDRSSAIVDKGNPNCDDGAPPVINSPYPLYSDCRTVESYEKVPAVWNAAKMLSEMNPDKRKIYTFFGKPDGTFDEKYKADGSKGWPSGGINLSSYEFSQANLQSLHMLMGQKSATQTNKLISYIRGTDDDASGYRSRTAHLPWNPDSVGPQVWRLGDVIHSKPIIVGSPSSNFHLTYSDKSYADYKTENAKRRQVVYFGSNDGMLHAVNLGYFGSLQEGLAGYHPNPDPKDNSTPKYKLGEEMWGYIPTSVLPHLQWLASKDYLHSYMVDLKPFLVDIKDPNGRWRTILIMGLRLGGRTIEMVNLKGQEPQYYFSEIFALDVTNPENPPKLMWRFSSPYLGLSTGEPTVVRSGDTWHVVIPSGPTSDKFTNGTFLAPGGTAAYDGTSTQNARVFILNAFTGQQEKELVVPEPKSFFNDTYVPYAYNVDKSKPNNVTWNHHVVYMGLTSRKPGVGNNTRAWDSGAVYRLKMANSVDGKPLEVSAWTLERMFFSDKPVTGAINSTRDALGNLWVLFGTGRVWSKNDMTPCGANRANVDAACCDNHEQYFYGLKEPLNNAGYMTFQEVGNASDHLPIVDVSNIKIYTNDRLSATPTGAASCITGESLYRYMISKDASGQPVVRGHKRKLETWRTLPDSFYTNQGLERPKGLERPNKTVFEIVDTQPKIDGLPNGRSNTVYTSVQMSDDLCKPEGHSFLNVVNTFTGIPASYMKDYDSFTSGDSISSSDGKERYEQITGVKDAGKNMASEAWIMKTSEGTIYGNTSFNSNRNTVFVSSKESTISDVISWREVLDMGFELQTTEDALFKDLK